MVNGTLPLAVPVVERQARNAVLRAPDTYSPSQSVAVGLGIPAHVAVQYNRFPHALHYTPLCLQRLGVITLWVARQLGASAPADAGAFAIVRGMGVLDRARPRPPASSVQGYQDSLPSQAYGLNVNGACVSWPMTVPVPGTAKAPNQV